MPAPPTSPLQEELGNRQFCFYPPIRNVAYNEWRFSKATWSETLVVNEKSGIEVWIPRRFFGAVSSVEEPVPIVGLNKELEYKAGSVYPFHQKILEMPRDAMAKPASEPAAGTARAATGMGRPAGSEGSIAKLIGVAVVIAVVALLSIVAIYRGGGFLQQRVILTANDQEYLSLGAGDDYFAVTRKLGQPEGDRWRTQAKEVSFRVLDYPKRAYSVVLFGADQASATYIGTLDANWRPIHSVNMGRGVDSSAMLRNLPRF